MRSSPLVFCALALLSFTACGTETDPDPSNEDTDQTVGDTDDSDTDATDTDPTDGDALPVDTTAPGAPTLTETTPSSPSNSVVNPTVHGTAEADTLVRIYRSGDCTGTLAVYGPASAGSFALVTSGGSENSTSTFSASATDAASNTSACSNALTYTHDSAAPTTPTITGPSSPSSNANPTIAGTADDGSTVTLYASADCSGVALDTATASSGFAIAVTVTPNTTTTFSATATDDHGNTSGCSASFGYLHDALPPTLPAITDTFPASPSSATNPLLEGTSDDGSSVTIYATSDCSGTPLVAPTITHGGAFSLEVSVIANTTTVFSLTATDAANNVTDCVASDVTFTHDDLPPGAPTNLATLPVSPGNNPTPAVSGDLTADTVRVSLYDNAACGGDPLASQVTTATFTLSPTVATDTTFYAQAFDAAGNPSDCSDGVAYVYDTAAPAAPDLSLNEPSPGTTLQIHLSATAEIGSTLDIFAGAGCSGVALDSFAVDAGGTVGPIDYDVIANSTNTYSARATDVAGNPSDCSTSVTYVNDLSPPPLPLLVSTTPASPSSELEPVIHGTSEAGVTVTLYVSAVTPCDTLVGSTMAELDGTWAIATTLTANTTTTFNATTTDALNNTSLCSTSFVTYVNDSSPPGTPTLSLTPSSSGTSTRPVATGTAEVGATMRLFTTGDCTGASTTTTSTGAFTLEGSVAPGASATFTVNATDAAGNPSGCSTAIPYTNTLVAAGEVYVALDGSHPTAATASWHNAGTIGDFARVGSPSAATVAGTQAVSFNTATTGDAYQSASAAPAGLVGADATRSVEAWVRNPTISDEETIVAWGNRSVVDNINFGFEYGSNGGVGAVNHHGSASRGWSPVPAAAAWHYLAYTYDGSSARFYVDGALQSTQAIGSVTTASANKVTLAQQLNDAAGGLSTGQRGSLSIARLRIHDGVLSDSNVADNYDNEGNEMFPADDCAVNPCAHGGTCTDGINATTCSCVAPWEGATCNTDHNDCSPNPCAHGSCFDGFESFTCSCSAGWVGPTCSGDCSVCNFGQTCVSNGGSSVACVGAGMAPVSICSATTCGPAPIAGQPVATAQACEQLCLANGTCVYAVYYPLNGFCNLHASCLPCQTFSASPNTKFVKTF